MPPIPRTDASAAKLLFACYVPNWHQPDGPRDRFWIASLSNDEQTVRIAEAYGAVMPNLGLTATDVWTQILTASASDRGRPAGRGVEWSVGDGGVRAIGTYWHTGRGHAESDRPMVVVCVPVSAKDLLPAVAIPADGGDGPPHTMSLERFVRNAAVQRTAAAGAYPRHQPLPHQSVIYVGPDLFSATEEGRIGWTGYSYVERIVPVPVGDVIVPQFACKHLMWLGSLQFDPSGCRTRTEWCSGGTMRIGDCQRLFSVQQRARIMRGVWSAVWFLHHGVHSTCHGYIRPDRVYANRTTTTGHRQRWVGVLGDYGAPVLRYMVTGRVDANENIYAGRSAVPGSLLCDRI